jgi:hypothetical protein
VCVRHGAGQAPPANLAEELTRVGWGVIPPAVFAEQASSKVPIQSGRLADAAVLVRQARLQDPLTALRAEGFRPVGWAGWQAIERAEAELGATLGRGVVKLPDWNSLMAAARAADIP